MPGALSGPSHVIEIQPEDEAFRQEIIARIQSEWITDFREIAGIIGALSFSASHPMMFERLFFSTRAVQVHTRRQLEVLFRLGKLDPDVILEEYRDRVEIKLLHVDANKPFV